MHAFYKSILQFLELNKKNTELLILLKKGDVTAFDIIFNMYSNKLHVFVLRYLKNEKDAEDIVQEVFIKIWEKRTKIDIYSSFESFLFTIAYNSTISLLRKRVSERKSFEYLKSVQQFKSAKNVIDELQYKELTNELDSLLEGCTTNFH